MTKKNRLKKKQTIISRKIIIILTDTFIFQIESNFISYKRAKEVISKCIRMYCNKFFFLLT